MTAVVAVSATALATPASAAHVPTPARVSTPAHHTGRTSTLPRFGDRGPSVTALQNALIAAGVAVSGGADGYFGSATRRAIATFQTANGLTSTGELNSTTAFLLGIGLAPTLPARGQRGRAVTSLQTALSAQGITVAGGADGVFGNGTQSAVIAFQTARGLPATGVVDIRTAIALGIVAGAAPSSPAPNTTTPGATIPGTSAPTTTTPTTTGPSTTAPSTGILAAIGASGSTVTAIQKALISAGVSVPGGADGRFGPGTETAVKTFQTDLRLAPTGQVDSTTAILLGVRPAPALPALKDRGDLVRILQTNLVAAGISVTGGVDGRFGAATSAAVAAYQTSQGLTATGKVDLRTALYLGLIPGGPVTGTSPSQPTTAPSSSATTTTTAPDTATAITPKVFPMPGPCWFSDTWQVARSGGRKHEGVDIIAKKGTPLYAVVDGTITRQFFDRPGSLGGNALRLTAADGTYFHYAHLDTFATGIAPGSSVTAGQVIGYVGTTGSSSTPHLHFEYHPFGGKAVNPYPVVKPLDSCRNTSGTTSTTTTTTTTTVAPG